MFLRGGLLPIIAVGLLVISLIQHQKILRLETQLAAARATSSENTIPSAELEKASRLAPVLRSKSDDTRLQQELARLSKECELLRQENDKMLRTNVDTMKLVERIYSRAKNISSYAKELRSVLDDALQKYAPDEYERQQKEMNFQPGDTVHLDNDLALTLFGSILPDMIRTNLEANPGGPFPLYAEMVTNMFLRVDITNYEQLRLSGFPEFRVSRSQGNK